MTRAEAFEAFLEVVVEAVPETLEDWPARRNAIRQAGMAYASAASQEAFAASQEAFAGAFSAIVGKREE